MKSKAASKVVACALSGALAAGGAACALGVQALAPTESGLVPQAQAKVYKVDSWCTFKGKLKKVRYKHAGNGKRLTGYVLVLNKKVKVKSDYGGHILKTKRIQIGNGNKSDIKKIRRKVGKKIKVSGSPFITSTVWWCERVALNDPSLVS